MKTIQLICDPGHGWGLVDVKELKELDILEDISRYSYISRAGDVAALEEDCDLPIYIAALNRAGIDCTYNEQYQEITPIRDWPSYCTGRVTL